MLPPSARLLWRSGREVQIELGGRRTVLDGVGSAAVRRLLGRPPAGVDADSVVGERVASDQPSDRPTDQPSEHAVEQLAEHLLRRGLLWPAAPPTGDGDLRQLPPVPRLAPEIAALTARAGERAAEIVAARRQCTVTVLGRGRVGPHVASVLAAGGVGRVHVADPGTVRLYHAGPGGVTCEQEGLPLSQAAAEVARRHAPEVDVLPPPYGQPPDLVVLAAEGPVDPERSAALHARGCAHLLVELSGGRGVVGPLVLPGLTSCLRCCDLHRSDRDPAWDALAAQLSLPHRGSLPSEVGAATIIAGIAVTQALDFLDGGSPATVEGSLELALPDWRVRRRSWPVHPHCSCMTR